MNNILDITWREPKTGSAVSYEIRILEYMQEQGSKIVTTSNLNPPFLEEVTDTQVQSTPLRKQFYIKFVNYVSVVLSNVGKLVPYAVIVMSLNSARCGETISITCFTEQGGEYTWTCQKNLIL